LRLALESVERRLIGEGILRQKFQRHLAFELGVFRSVNHAHPATTEFLDDAVVRNRLPYKRGGIRHLTWDFDAAEI